MEREGNPPTERTPPACRESDCESAADFWLYRPERGWRPRCERHVVQLHPSLELHAWLAAGYARPVERGRPTEPPSAPRTGREAAFREAVDEALD